jgi:hypothetical protein
MTADERATFGVLPHHALPTGTVTFLFTDIAGSTKLLQQLGDAYAEALRESLGVPLPALDWTEIEQAVETRFALTTESNSKHYYHLACAERDHPERLRDAMERFKIRGSQQTASSEDDVPF